MRVGAVNCSITRLPRWPPRLTSQARAPRVTARRRHPENGNCGTARRRTAENCRRELPRYSSRGRAPTLRLETTSGEGHVSFWGNCSSRRLLPERARAEVKSSSQRPAGLSATAVPDPLRDARIREPFSASLACSSRQFSFLQFPAGLYDLSDASMRAEHDAGPDPGRTRPIRTARSASPTPAS